MWAMRHAYEEAKGNPRRQSCFYQCEINDIVSDVSRKLFMEAFYGKQLRILSERDITEEIGSKVRQFMEHGAVASGSPILSSEFSGEDLLKENDKNVDISKRRAESFGYCAKNDPVPLNTGIEMEFLGTSSSRSTSTRNTSAILVRFTHRGGTYLFDCGEGTSRQFIHCQSGTTAFDLQAVFITHLHGDHFYGLPGLGMQLLDVPPAKQPYLFAPSELTRCFRGPLSLRGFKPIDVQRPSTAKSTTGPLNPDKEDDSNGDGCHFNNNDKCYKLYEDKNCIIKAHPIRHSIFCLGFVIEEKNKRLMNEEKLKEYGLLNDSRNRNFFEGKPVTLEDGRVITGEDVFYPARKPRKIVILGDTYDPSAITDLAQDADVLVHEATYLNEEYSLAKLHKHSTAGMAGKFSRTINARNLILTHFSPRNMHHESEEVIQMRTLVNQAQLAAGMDNVFAAHDFWRFPVPLGPYLQ